MKHKTIEKILKKTQSIYTSGFIIGTSLMALIGFLYSFNNIPKGLFKNFVSYGFGFFMVFIFYSLIIIFFLTIILKNKNNLFKKRKTKKEHYKLHGKEIEVKI